MVGNANANIDVEELERMKKALPVGKCIETEMTIDGEEMGIKVCRVGEDEFQMEGKGALPMKGSLRIVDYEEK